MILNILSINVSCFGKSISNFLPFIKPSTKHVFIDNYDSVFKPIIEQVSDGNKLTRGSLIVTTTTMCMYPNFETVIIPPSCTKSASVLFKQLQQKN